MRIRGEVEAGSLLLRLRNGQKRLDYAVSQAVNRTGLGVQQDLFANARAKFNIRVPGFFFGYGARTGGVAAKITRFANAKKGVLDAEIVAGREATSVGKGRSVLFGSFERGGRHVPAVGRARFAVPVTGIARSALTQRVHPWATWPGMRLTAWVGGRRVKRGGKASAPERGFGSEGSATPAFELGSVQWKGRHRTFMLMRTRQFPLGAVFQRVGPGRDDIVPVHVFKSSTPLDTRLAMMSVAEASWRRRYRPAFDDAVRETLTYHRFAFVR